MHLSSSSKFCANASFKMEFGNYEVSLSFDTFPNKKGYLENDSICVYKDDVNVTKELFDVMEIFGDEEKFLEICNVISRLSKLTP
ncbi:hypothetical protein HN385_07340 [archaeon]|jgi:hypothetical protein|nr:hypothetical protein [archaeon]